MKLLWKEFTPRTAQISLTCISLINNYNIASTFKKHCNKSRLAHRSPKIQKSSRHTDGQPSNTLDLYLYLFPTHAISSPGWWVPPGSDSFQLPQIPILGGESPAGGAQLSQTSHCVPRLIFRWMWMSPSLAASDSGHGSTAVYWAHASISLPDLKPN